MVELSEVKMEVKMEVNSLRSWKLKRTFAYKQTASKAIVQPVLLVSLGSAAWLVQELHFITPETEIINNRGKLLTIL